MVIDSSSIVQKSPQAGVTFGNVTIYYPPPTTTKNSSGHQKKHKEPDCTTSFNGLCQSIDMEEYESMKFNRIHITSASHQSHDSQTSRRRRRLLPNHKHTLSTLLETKDEIQSIVDEIQNIYKSKHSNYIEQVIKRMDCHHQQSIGSTHTISTSTVDVHGAVVQSVIVDKLQKRSQGGTEIKHDNNDNCMPNISQNARSA